MPEISVIIPAFDHAKTIGKTLDFIFAQSFKDIEVIVVNDGSTDNTEEVLKPYLSRIIYKKIENSGAPKARNLGFSLSHGQYVIFCDADVISMDTDMLKKLYNALQASPNVSYAYCGFYFGRAHFKPVAFDADRLRKVNYIHTTSLIRRTDFFGFDETIKKFQDWDLWLSLLEKNKIGVLVNETLISFEPRRNGISHWLPKIFYSGLLDIFGIKPKAVIRYRHFSEVIAKKHGLNLDEQIKKHNWLWMFLLLPYFISIIAFKAPLLGSLVSLIVMAAVYVVSTNRLLYGVIIMFSELILGSLAGKLVVLTLPGLTLPLRLIIFAIVGLVWFVRLMQKRIRAPQKNVFVAVIMMLVVVGWGIVNGLLNGISLRNVFFDANAYFALPMILFFVSAVESEKDQLLLKKVLKHGTIALSVLTILALYFFSHRFPNMAGVFAYKWLRDSRIAEITALNGGIYRIFIQSQLFCLMSFLFLVLGGKEDKVKNNIYTWLWGILPATALIISGSRSFLLGIMVALGTWFIMVLVAKSQIKEKLLTAIKKFVIFIGVGLIIYTALLFIPLPALRNQTSFQDMLSSRSVSNRDSATASRWSLLPKLNEKIKEAPLLGNGFGTSVTYISSDQRIINSTGGKYTTSAFEWNYHDILVKVGVLGLLVYGFLLYVILLTLIKAPSKDRLWLVPSFFALLAINFLSPFLNHPLGIGYIALLFALAQNKQANIVPVAVEEIIKAPTPAMRTAMAGSAVMSEE